jgi:hypothetical protein
VAQLWSLGSIHTLMKYTLPLFALSLCLTGCNRQNDVTVRQNLPGTWTEAYNSSVTNDGGTFTIATNGDFVCRTAASNGVVSLKLAGTFKVEDGFLVMRVTNSINTNHFTPFESRAKIVQADAHQMTIMDNGNKEFMQKVTP